jgi:hypothetical protein
MAEIGRFLVRLAEETSAPVAPAIESAKVFEVQHLITFVDSSRNANPSSLPDKGLDEMLHRLLSFTGYDANPALRRSYHVDSWRPNNVMWCSATTTEEEIDIFLLRMGYVPGNYTLLQPNLLPIALQKRILDFQISPNRTTAPASLLLILNTRSSVFQSSEPGVREIRGDEFCSFDRSCRANGADTRVFLEKILQKSCVNVTLVVGRSGDGKSHRIRQLCGIHSPVIITLHEQVDPSVIVRKLLRIGQPLDVADIPLSAAHMAADAVTVSDVAGKPEALLTETNVVFDVSGNSPPGDLNLVLFNLLVCGRLHDAVSGQVFSFSGNSAHKWNIFLELPSHGPSGSDMNENGDVMYRPDWNLEFDDDPDFESDAYWENHMLKRVQLPVPWFASRLEKVQSVAAFFMPNDSNWELVATYLLAFYTHMPAQVLLADEDQADPRAIINMTVQDVQMLAEQTPNLPVSLQTALRRESFQVTRSALAMQLNIALNHILQVDATSLTDHLSEQQCISVFREEAGRYHKILNRKLFMRIYLLYMSRRINYLNDPTSGTFFRYNGGDQTGGALDRMGTTLLQQMSTEVLNILEPRVRDDEDAPTLQVIYGTRFVDTHSGL